MRAVFAVIEKDGEILSVDTNWHSPCLRNGMPTGEGYELCSGCDYDNHAEANALEQAIELRGAEMVRDAICHLYGHTYACTICLDKLIEAGVSLEIHT